jgi:DNA primase
LKGFNDEIKAEIRSRAKILDIVSEHVVMKRTGNVYKGNCPFHNEKTPSFNVNPEKGIFHCFGCNEGGDVFAFIMKIKNVDFPTSVRELAQKTGVQLIETRAEQGEYDRKSAILMLYQQAAEYYAHLLQDKNEGAHAMEYLERRGLDADTVARFKLGYAPMAWDGLLRYLSDANKASPETLAEAGLVRRKPDSNHFYDLFRNRLMIPIQDEQGRVIAFGGRTLGDDQVKYLNSPESPIYIKGEHLFALQQAKDEIKRKDAVIVVEGYFDAITAHQYGFKNTVATLGTALTERQGKLLVRFTDRKRVYLCFDSDAAGEKAVDRGMELLTQLAEGIGIEMRAIRVPGAKDPDEILRSTDSDAGPAAFAKAIETAPLLLDYQLERAAARVDKSTGAGRVEASKSLLPILSSIKNAVARGEYIRQWALKLGIREEDLLSDVNQFRRQGRMSSAEPTKPRPAAAKNAPQAGSSVAELSLLAIYLLSPEDYQLMMQKLSLHKMSDPVYQRIKDALESIGRFPSNEAFWSALQDKLADDADASKRLWELSSKADEIKRQNLPISVILNDYEARLVRERLIRAINTMSLKIKQRPGEEEELKLSFQITQLTRLQQEMHRMTEDGLEEVKRKLDALLVET